MIAVIQRVKHAKVSVDGEVIGKCGKGYLILLGVANGDDKSDADVLAEKISKLRIFSDENDKINLSVNDVSGEILVVPNFTLLASCKKGNRPDFVNSAPPAEAKALYLHFAEYMAELTSHVETGEFGADMEVSICNDGPFTVVIDSRELNKKNIERKYS